MGDSKEGRYGRRGKGRMVIRREGKKYQRQGRYEGRKEGCYYDGNK